MSEITNIPLGGVSNEPNDYGSEDGALSLSLNAVKHHGSIRPVMPGSPVEDIGELPKHTDVVAIHEVGDMKHYILLEEIEKPAGSRPVPGSEYITVHYACRPQQVMVWWTTNDPSLEGDTLSVGIGVGEESQLEDIPWGGTVIVEAKYLAVAETTDASGDTIYTYYNYYDQSKHFTDDAFFVMGTTKEGVDISGYTRKAECSDPPKTELIINCLCMKDKVRMSLQYKWKKISSMSLTLDGIDGNVPVILGPAYTPEIDTSKLSVGEDEQGTPIPYNIETGDVLTEDCFSFVGLYYEGNEYTDFQTNGIINTDYYSLQYNFIIPEDQDETIPPSGEIPGEDPDSKEDATYRMYYREATQEASEPVLITNVSGDAISVTPMGNVLTVAAKGKPLNYIIWKDREYHVLGSEVDAPRVYPYLLTRPMGISEFYSQFGYDFKAKAADTKLTEDNNLTVQDWETLSKGKTEYLTFNATQRKFVYDRTFAIVNSAYRTLSSKGFFYAPFHVRFALRMYDGTHIMHSPCYLMIPCAEGKPILGVEIDSSGGAHLHPVFAASRLFADIGAFSSKWDDIVTHIDVFVTQPHINYTDDERSINGACVTYIASEKELEGQAVSVSQPGGAIKEFDPMYQRSRKQIGNLFSDYKDPSNKASYINMGTLSFRGGDKRIITPDFTRSAAYFYLIDKTRYPNISASYIDGTNRTLTQANDTLVIGNTAEDEDGNKENILLSDTGLTNLTNYVYFEVQSSDTSIKRSIMLSGYDEVDITLVWCYRSTIVAERPLNYMLDLRRTDGTNYMDVIQDSNVFHLVKSISTKDLRNGQTGDIYIRENILDNLDSRQTLPDQGQMRSRVTTDIAPFAYNNRLSMAASTWDLPATSAIADFCVQNEPEDGKGYYIEKAWVKALVNGQVAYKRLEIGTDSGRYTYAENIRYFYYPCYEATHLILQVLHEQATDGKPHKVMEFSMDKHKLLNGAYLFNNFDSISPTKTYSYAKREEMLEDELLNNAKAGPPTVTYGNMVRVSNVANPFYFNEVNQVTLPTGTISGLSTTAKALSQGQFGAFPLYCFSDNGIWALEVSDTGTYSAKQPVSRAVCTNPESITQTEGSVLFVTKRGLMALDGSNVTCVSEILSGHNYTSALSKLYEVKKLAGLEEVPNPDTHIEEWLQDARLLYDDKRQMIYAFNGENVLGYMYSISDQAWGMMVHDLDHPLPCYTDALAVTREDGEGKRRLVNMSDHTGCGAAPKSVLVTRPLTFGSADAYKSIEALTLRGMLDKDDAKLVVWASNDLKHWAVVASSQTSWYRGKSGTPYKYYRIGIVLEWEEEDSLNAIGADITTRLTNRIR